MAWEGCDPALAGPGQKGGGVLLQAGRLPGAGELCQREGGGGGWGGGYGREMHVGEMVAVLVGQARREGQQEVTCSIPLSAQLSLGRCWAEPMAPSPPLSCSPGQGRKRKEARKEGRAAVRRRALQRWGQLLGSPVLLSQSLQRLSFSGGSCNTAIGTSGRHFGVLDCPVLWLGAWPGRNTRGVKRKKETR